MSKASEWADSMVRARNAVEDVRNTRPEPPPPVPIKSFSLLKFDLTEAGHLTIIIETPGDNGVHTGGLVRPEDVGALLVAARWILDTLGEPAP